jgi:hypothetical protein
MNDAIRLQLSAFVDGELPDNESELLLRRLSQDAALRQQVAEYMQLGRLIRGDREPAGISQLRGRISAALGEEVVREVEVAKFVPARLFRPVAGVAIAASVAVAALVGLRQVSISDDASLNAGSENFAAVAIDDSSMYTELLSDEFVSDRPSDMLAQFYLHHGERAGNGANIVTRLVTLELREGELQEIEPRLAKGADQTDVTSDVDNTSPAPSGN